MKNAWRPTGRFSFFSEWILDTTLPLQSVSTLYPSLRLLLHLHPAEQTALEISGSTLLPIKSHTTIGFRCTAL